MLRRTKNSISEVSRDQLAVLQESWGVVSHLSGMKLHQLPFRPFPSAQCHYTSCISVFFSSYLSGLPFVDLPVFAACLGFKGSNCKSAHWVSRKTHL